MMYHCLFIPQKELVCSKHPTQIDITCEFVVGTSKLSDAENTKYDDCGSWKETKTAATLLGYCV